MKDTEQSATSQTTASQDKRPIQRKPAPGKTTRVTSAHARGGGAGTASRNAAPGDASGDSVIQRASAQSSAAQPTASTDWTRVAFRPDVFEAPVQRKASGPVSGPASGSPAPSGPGESLPAAVQTKMEGSLGADFSSVRVHQGPQAQALGAQAYTQGTDVHFAPGQYNPSSQSGQELIGHELTHVVQQSQGRVQADSQAKGVDINTSSSLEREADDMGARAARGEPTSTSGQNASPANGQTGGGAQMKAASGGPIQAAGEPATDDAAPAEEDAAAVESRDRAIESVNDLLSYGLFDWAITDAEATQAINLLGALPMDQLRVAVTQIDTDRLLDNVPAAARRSENFAKVITAMGPENYRGFVQELLSYGLFDWAITDSEVRTITDILGVLGPAEKRDFLASLNATDRSRLAENLTRDEASYPLYRMLFDATPDGELAALKSILGARFNLSLDSWFLPRMTMGIEQDWDAPGLRRLYTLFEQIPPEHIQDNDQLDMFLRQSTTNGSGVYYGAWDAGVVSYGNVNATGGYGAIMQPDGSGGMTDVGLNTNVNLFNTVVRHEVGHAVDAQIGASDDGGYVRTAANAGAWGKYGSKRAFVDAIIAAGGGMSGHGYADEAKYEQAMRDAVDDEVDFNTALDAIDSSVAKPSASVAGPVAAVFEKNRWHPDTNPWYSNGDRQDVGGRLWQRPYGSGDFVSFLKSARSDHGVSAYQFRAPGEWFAEAYAVYYSDHDSVTGDAPGTRLRTRDAASADWFDTNVDGGHSLQEEAGDGGGAGAGGGGAGGAGGGAGGAGG